jgi:hypothetical protein
LDKKQWLELYYFPTVYLPTTIKLNVGIEFIIMAPDPLIPLPRASNVDKLMILAPITDCVKFPLSV